MRERLAAFSGAPAGEDRHIGAQRALGVAGIGAARRFGMLAQAGTNFGFRDGGRHGRDLGRWAAHWTMCLSRPAASRGEAR
jgi:hypothetical protein